MLALCLASGALLGCTVASDPLVDRMGVSDARYAKDLADCKQQNHLPIGFSNPIATCLSGKGYEVLMGK